MANDDDNCGVMVAYSSYRAHGHGPVGAVSATLNPLAASLDQLRRTDKGNTEYGGRGYEPVPMKWRESKVA